MAIIHLGGTQLEPIQTKAPLSGQVMVLLGLIYLLVMHIFLPNLNGTSIELPFNALTWIGFGLVFCVGFYQITLSQKIRYSKLTITLFICCLLLTIPALMPNSSHLLVALPRLSALWAGWLLLFILQQFQLSNQHKQRLLWFILLASFIEAAIGYGQLFHLLPKKILGNTPFTSSPFGIFQHADTMSSFLATGVLISGYLLVRQHQFNKQRRRYGHHVGPTILLYLTPLYQMPLIAMIASRTAWYGIALGLLMVISYLYRSSTPQRYSGWVSTTVAGVGLGLMLASSFQFNHQSAIATSDITIESAEAPLDKRQYIFPQALDMLIEKPFTGYGYGSFESEYVLYTARQHQLNADYRAALSGVNHPLNETLFWGIEGGLFALTGILVAITLVLLKIYSARKGTRIAVLGLFMPIVLSTQFGNPFYQAIIHWFSFIILLFWVDQRTARYKTMLVSKTTRIGMGSCAVLLPVFIGLYMLLALQTNSVLVKYQKTHPKDSTLLEQIPYPVTQRITLEWEKKRNMLKQSILANDPVAINHFIDWALLTIKEQPRASYYKSLILAYQAMGETSKAEQIKTEASFLFPDIDFSALSIAPISAILAPTERLEESQAEQREH